jgi:hypothetical protein
MGEETTLFFSIKAPILPGSVNLENFGFFMIL